MFSSSRTRPLFRYSSLPVFQSSSLPVFQSQLSRNASGEPVTGAGDTEREEGGGDTGEEGADEEVAGKRNYGSLTPCGYTRTSLSMLPAKLTLA